MVTLVHGSPPKPLNFMSQGQRRLSQVLRHTAATPTQATRLVASCSSKSMARPKPNDSVFFLCDVQETFRPVILDFPRVLAVSCYMSKIGKALNIPVIASEQNPFKPTCAEISMDGVKLFRKTRFSMLVDEIRAELTAMPAVKNVFLYGLETHVCVLQTTQDLVNMGYNVHLVVDGISSQRAMDRDVALRRMEQLPGVSMTTAESAIYQIVEDSKHEKFKAVLTHVKELQSALKTM